MIFIAQNQNGYSKETIEIIKKQYENTPEESKAIKPNVILIMNESYSDLSKLSNVTYSRKSNENNK